MQSVPRKTLWHLALLLLVASAAFVAGFLCGRMSCRQDIIELEEAAKSTGWWNMQLEEEVQTLREKLHYYEEENPNKKL